MTVCLEKAWSPTPKKSCEMNIICQGSQTGSLRGTNDKEQRHFLKDLARLHVVAVRIRYAVAE